MSGTFSATCDILDVPGGEAKWSASFGAGGVVSVKVCDTKLEGEQWLAAQTRAFLGARVVFDAPDGDGVVVAPHHEDRVVFTAPALAVRVREASPMASRPQIAAQVAERIYYAMRLLDEAEQVLADAHLGGDFAPMVWKAQRSVATVVEYSACEVFEQWPIAGVEPEYHERHLSVVPDGGVA